MLTDRQMDKKQTNKQTELHQFRKEPSYDGDLSVKFEFNWTQSGNGNFDGQMDKNWTNDGHINLIGGLVTRNLPKKSLQFIIIIQVKYFVALEKE